MDLNDCLLNWFLVSVLAFNGLVCFGVSTWVLDRVNGDLVVGFAGTQSGHHIFNPPQLALHLSFLLLYRNIQMKSTQGI